MRIMRVIDIMLLVTSMAIVMTVVSGCPTRPNPLLDGSVVPDAESDVSADGDVTADADEVVDADAVVDSAPDADGCTPSKILCDGECVSISSPNHCGDCDTRCQPQPCQCRSGPGDEFGCYVGSSGNETCEAE